MGAITWHGLRMVRSPPIRKVKCLGSTLASKASGTLTGVWIETDRLPPIRVVLWEETGLQNRSAGFDSLTARQVIQVWVAGIPAAL
jgi:hypothetical protein